VAGHSIRSAAKPLQHWCAARPCHTTASTHARGGLPTD
jgi:hypothetical protein